MKRALLICAVIVLLLVGAGIMAWPTWRHAQDMTIWSRIIDTKPAMTVDQVEAVAGRPSQIETAESTGIKGAVYHYTDGGSGLKIVFVNGVIFHAEFAPGAKS